MFEVTERYTLISNDEIYYRFTVTDPMMYTTSVTVENSLTRLPAGDKQYEQACREGNYSLTGILAGARRQELDALE